MRRKDIPLVSIIVPCYNSRERIVSCLKNFLKTNYKNFEIIVVDDDSKDGTYELLKEKFSMNRKVRIIKNHKNFGPSYTRNQGVKAARGKYIAFLETDMEVDPDWLDPLVAKLENNEMLGAVQSKVLDINKRDFIQAVGVLYDPHTFWVVGLGCGLHKDAIHNPQEVSFGAVGSLVRKNVLDKIGGFDTKLVYNVDDIDLGWRTWIAGYSVVTVPESITYHWTSKPLGTREKITPSSESEFHFHKTPRIFLKNYEWKNVVRYLPWLFIVFSARVVKNLVRGNPKPFYGFVKATLWNIKTLPDTLRERQRIQRLRKRTDSDILKKIALKGSFWQIYIGKILPALERAMVVFNS